MSYLNLQNKKITIASRSCVHHLDLKKIFISKNFLIYPILQNLKLNIHIYSHITSNEYE
jgi:hypothetical protein